MNARNRLAALLAAGSLVMALAAVTSAAPPTYGVDLVKTASPATVPSGGGDVLYTITAQATGTGFFGTVTVDDGMTGCTLSAPTGDSDADGNLDPGETWTYTCTVTGVLPETANTATVNACHNGSGACNQSTHDATDTASFTVHLGPDVTAAPTGAPTEAPTVAPTAVPTAVPTVAPTAVPTVAATEVPVTTEAPTATANPTADVGDDVDATLPSSDAAFGNGGTSAPPDRSWMLVLALGLLLASIIVVNPSRSAREGDRQ